MKSVIFKTIKFRNLNSFGNELQTFSFTQGVNLISGESGSGKSTILEAICFCLYGVPYRNVKIAEIINRVNEENFYTECELEINGKLIKIERGLKPDIFNIIVNNEKLESRSSKKLDQKELDTLLGIDIVQFKNLICLSASLSKSIISMNPQERKQIFEKILDVDSINAFLKDVKNQVSLYRGLEYESRVSLKAKKDLLEGLNKTLSEIKKEEIIFNANKDIELKNINRDIESNINALKILALGKNLEQFLDPKTIQAYKVSIDEAKKLETSNKEQLNSKHISKKAIETNRKHKEKQIKIFQEGICPHCLANLNSDNAKTIKENILSEINSLKKEEESIESRIKENESIAKEIQKDLIDKHNSLVEYEQIKAEIAKRQDILDGLDFKKKVISEKVFQVNAEDLKARISSESDLKKGIEANHKEYDKQKIIYEQSLNILNDEVLRKKIFSQISYIFGNYVQNYIKILNLPHKIEFESIDDIKIYDERNSEVSFESLSMGEKTRMNIAFQFSFYDLNKFILQWNCNLSFYDEVLDTHLDSNSVDRVMDILLSRGLKMPEACIYVVSHTISATENKNGIDSKFAKIIKFSKQEDFSIFS